MPTYYDNARSSLESNWSRAQLVKQRRFENVHFLHIDDFVYNLQVVFYERHLFRILQLMLYKKHGTWKVVAYLVVVVAYHVTIVASGHGSDLSFGNSLRSMNYDLCSRSSSFTNYEL